MLDVNSFKEKVKDINLKGQIAKSEFISEFIYNSNAIECNPFSLDETREVLDGKSIEGRSLKDHQEVTGHKDAIDFVIKSLENDEYLSDDFIKDIHSFLLLDRPYDKGRYRTIPVRIMGAYHSPSNPLSIATKISDLVFWYNNEDNMNIIEKIALFHMKFEGIHPFIDGNGRTGRLIMNYMLVKSGLLPIVVKYENCNSYYDAFDSFYKDEDTSPMIRIIEDALEESYNKLS